LPQGVAEHRCCPEISVRPWLGSRPLAPAGWQSRFAFRGARGHGSEFETAHELFAARHGEHGAKQRDQRRHRKSGQRVVEPLQRRDEQHRPSLGGRQLGDAPLGIGR
jgi:hypothetical protein